MIINHNISAIFSHRQLKNNTQAMDGVGEKLASGLRINRAADDAAGLAVSEKMRAQIRGLNQAVKNTENGISFIQTTEGYLEGTQSVLQRLRELAVQAANGIYTTEDRTAIQVEVSQLIDEIDRIASHAQFNTINMLTGRFSQNFDGITYASMWIHLGANMDQRERLYIQTMTSKALGLTNVSTNEKLSLSTQNNANRAIGDLDIALHKVSKQRADLGAYQNRLESAVKSLMVGAENLQAAESRVRDADMAREMVEYVKNQILTQASTSILAQANLKSQGVLRLLG